MKPPPRYWCLSLALFACGPGDPPAGNDETTGTPGETTTVSTTATSTTGAPEPTTGSTGDGSGTTTALPGTTGCPGACTDTSEPSTFIVRTDHGGGGVECDVWAQDCPVGQKCSAYAEGGGSSWNATKCVPVMENPKQPDEPCMVEGNGVSGIDDCDLGAYCWDTNAENVGHCVALCKGTPDAPFCEDPTDACAITGEGVINLCLDACDPLFQDCVHEADVCIGSESGDGFECVPDASGEEGQQHDPCELANECDPGLSCLDPTAAVECDPNAMGCCQPYCDLTDPDADALCGGEGQVCTPYYEEGTAPPGQDDIGYCALPP